MKTGDADSSGIPSNVPAFLVKLWKLVEDPQYEEHISWNKASLFKLNYLSYSQPSLYFFGFRIRPLYLLETLIICILVILLLICGMNTAITTIRSFSCRMELVSSFTIRPLLHAKSFRSISNTTILRALFVS